MSEVFEVNGNKWQWYVTYYDDEPYLKSIEYNGGKSRGCGNPWNLIENGDEKDHIMKHKPKRKSMPDIDKKPCITITYFDKTAVYQDINDYLGGDCWSCYITDDNRNILKTYFNTFEHPDRNDPVYIQGYEIRDKLVDDTTPLIEALDRGETVYIILNQWFVDSSFKKVPNIDLYVRTEVRYH